MRSKRAIIAAVSAVLFTAGILLGLTSSASAGTPTPTPAYPTVTATPTPTPTPTVGPFAGCNFSTTQAFTFDPNRGRFVIRLIPAIVCDGPGRLVRVFALLGAPNFGR